MIKESENLISEWPNWPECDNAIKPNFLNPWRDNVTEMINKAQVTEDETT